MRARITTIVVNYNAGPLLRTCIDSVLCCPQGVEIIVVDNASTDDSLTSITGLPGVHIIRNATNEGFASGCNTGARAASSDFLLFLNPDCSVEPGALVKLHEAFAAGPQIGMVGGFLINLDGTEQAGGRRAVPTPWRSFVRAFGLARFSNRWPRLFFDFHLHKQALPAQPIEVEAISGACMMVRRSAMQDVGEWDEGYFLHCEDLDLCMRFRQKDWKILFVPSAPITHVLGVCGRSRPVFVEWHKHKGMMRFYRKFFQHQYPSFLMGLVGIGVWLRFALVVTFQGIKRFRQKFGFGNG